MNVENWIAEVKRSVNEHHTQVNNQLNLMNIAVDRLNEENTKLKRYKDRCMDDIRLVLQMLNYGCTDTAISKLNAMLGDG